MEIDNFRGDLSGISAKPKPQADKRPSQVPYRPNVNGCSEIERFGYFVVVTLWILCSFSRVWVSGIFLAENIG